MDQSGTMLETGRPFRRLLRKVQIRNNYSIAQANKKKTFEDNIIEVDTLIRL